MPPSHHYSQSQNLPRHSILPPSSTAAGPPSMSAAKTRQYANLQAQLEQLNANLADTQNLLRMTAVQAEVLGEEGVKGNADKKESES
ncbi:hypothetical protein AARAC_011648 [Aspergillus arachidicola]|uniref:Uncharacterized protein n=1 Tax=Aspergillus arachidicola TaxID=656916 RepID=A0A2G7FHP0_9EURO|nr:hypothetical protein AARAC_011648 [Aspergillus arachidicola]